jgi:hypothetical protein
MVCEKSAAIRFCRKVKEEKKGSNYMNELDKIERGREGGWGYRVR